MKSLRFQLTSVLGLVCLITMGSANSVITIDEKVKHQTIDGFGGFGGMNPTFTSTALYDTAFVKLILQDLGLSIIRMEITPDFEGTISNTNPDSLDTSSTINPITKVTTKKLDVLSAAGTRKWVSYLRERVKQGQLYYGIPKLIATTWSPPAWMKQNGSTMADWEGDQNNTIKSDATTIGEYGRMMAGFVLSIKERCGMDVYAVSPQNEPDFSQSTFNSCYYTPGDVKFKNIVVAIGDWFAKEGISKTKIFWPEDMVDVGRLSSYINVVTSDPKGNQYSSIIATHGYDADAATPGSNSANFWQQMKAVAVSKSKPLWMTETSGYSDKWGGETRNGTTFAPALELPEAIYSALNYGDAAAWVWWNLGEPSDPVLGANPYDLLNVKIPTKRYYLSKHYYRYIRPGAIRVDCSSPDALLMPVAFIHPVLGMTTIVVINTGGSDKTIDLQGDSLPANFRLFVTTKDSTVNFVEKPLVTRTFTSPAQSVATLVYESPAAVIQGIHTRTHPAVVGDGEYVKVFDLSGRLISSFDNKQVNAIEKADFNHLLGSRVAAGVYYGVMVNKAGQAVRSFAIDKAK